MEISVKNLRYVLVLTLLLYIAISFALVILYEVLLIVALSFLVSMCVLELSSFTQ